MIKTRKTLEMKYHFKIGVTFRNQEAFLKWIKCKESLTEIKLQM